MQPALSFSTRLSRSICIETETRIPNAVPMRTTSSSASDALELARRIEHLRRADHTRPNSDGTQTKAIPAMITPSSSERRCKPCGSATSNVMAAPPDRGELSTAPTLRRGHDVPAYLPTRSPSWTITTPRGQVSEEITVRRLPAHGPLSTTTAITFRTLTGCIIDRAGRRSGDRALVLATASIRAAMPRSLVCCTMCCTRKSMFVQSESLKVR